MLIDNAEDLDTVVLMYNFLEYNDNYSMTSRNCGIVIETKLAVMMMMMLQGVNHLSIKQK